MNQKYILIVFATLLLSGLNLFGQEIVTGRVVNKGGNPIEGASVYINGTTLRTVSNKNGAFEMRGVRFPCQLVVSHLSYQTQKITMDSASYEPLLLKLKEKDIALSEVLVEGKDKRKELLQSFLDNFLGNDTWGKAAKLRNENALIYQVTYNEDSSNTSFSGDLRQLNLPRSIVERTFVAQAKEPLQIDLPLLGYILSIDLDFFSLVQTRPYFDASNGLYISKSEIGRYLGSYSVQPYEEATKSKQRLFERNRKEAFYNSRMHFCRSLYRKELLKNGFLFMTTRKDSTSGVNVYDWINLDTCSRYDEKGNLFIYGLAGKKFIIRYFGHANGSPVDMSKKKYKNPLDYASRYELYNLDSNSSAVYFSNDTCIIQSNGIVPDVGISFSGKISQKKVGATLPEEYTPPIE